MSAGAWSCAVRCKPVRVVCECDAWTHRCMEACLTHEAPSVLDSQAAWVQAPSSSRYALHYQCKCSFRDLSSSA